MSNPIDIWIERGAGPEEGLRLLSQYAPSASIERLVKANPKKFSFLLLQALKPFASSEPKRVSVPAIRSFRSQWQFLDDPDCPMELKILAADKITAYRTYTSEHARLHECTTERECFERAKKIIENFKQNRKILSEFAYYQEHHRPLGKHPIFSELKRIAELRSLPIMELLRKKKNLEGSIWRARSEIKKGDKPHLDQEREDRIASRTRELREVEKMISDFIERNREFYDTIRPQETITDS